MKKIITLLIVIVTINTSLYSQVTTDCGTAEMDSAQFVNQPFCRWYGKAYQQLLYSYCGLKQIY